MGSSFVCSSSEEEEAIDQLTLQETLRSSDNGRRGPFRPGAAFTAVWTLDPRDPRVNGITEGGAGDGGQLGQRRRDAGLRRREEAGKKRRLRKMKDAAPLVVPIILASVKLQRKGNVYSRSREDEEALPL